MRLVLQAVVSLTVSTCFQGMLESASSLVDAVTSYKTLVTKDLAVRLRIQNEQASRDEESNALLLSRYLSSPADPVQDIGRATDPATVPSLKRGVSAVLWDGDLTRIQKKKSTILALAALNQIPGGGSDDTAIKRSALLTREKLRAGLHDPKGLLDLEGPTTSAIERTKRLELLKRSGC